MKKIKLHLENLRVDSFAVQPADAAPQGGTVRAHNPVPNPTDWGNTCSGCSREGLPCCTWPYCTETC